MNRTVLKTLSLGTLLALATNVVSCSNESGSEGQILGGDERQGTSERKGAVDAMPDGFTTPVLPEACDGEICCPEAHTPRFGTTGDDHEVNKDSDVCFVMLDGHDHVINNAKGAGAALGGDGDDFLRGPKGPSFLAGGAGDDRINAMNDVDEIDGGAGEDRVNAGQGDDRIACGTGDDRANGNAGADEITGSFGDDVLNGNGGDDSIMPGPGADDVDAGDGDDVVLVRDVCELSNGETLAGGSGQDTLVLPVEESDLPALGVTVSGFETIDVDPVLAHESECHCFHGTPVEITDETVTCECDPGWVGERCDECEDDQFDLCVPPGIWTHWYNSFSNSRRPTSRR